jgi:ubiquinone/menaquinone biosynthesis C-methylase UbiE
MDLIELQKHWDEFAKTDPLWSILTWPDKKGNKWQLAEFLETGAREVQEVMKYVESLGITLPWGKALDFGCGVGRLTQALACYFDEVCGVDIAATMVELAHKYNQYGLKCRYYVNASGSLSFFSDDTFDFIYTSYTLQHMQPRYSKNYIKEFLRVLVPHGLLIFQQPSERTVVSNKTEGGNERVMGEAAEGWFMPGVKRFVKCVTPGNLLDAYRRGRRRNVKNLDEPRMEMHVIRRGAVVKVVEESGGKIVDIVENQACGPELINYRYAVTKP